MFRPFQKWNLLATIYCFTVLILDDIRVSANEARYICTENKDNAEVMDIMFQLSNDASDILTVYAYQASTRATPYPSCQAVNNSQSNGFTFQLSFNMTSNTQISPATDCGIQYTSDKVIVVLRTFQTLGMDTASDRFYVITCDKAQLTSLWVSSTSLAVGDVDDVDLDINRGLSFKMVSLDTGSVPLSYSVGDKAYLELQMTFTSAIEGIDYLGAMVVNVEMSSNLQFNAPVRYLVDSDGCPVTHEQPRIMALDKSFIVISTPGVSPFVSRTSVLEIARFTENSGTVYIRAELQYCTRSTDSCFETEEDRKARCDGRARKKRSIGVFQSEHTGRVTRSVVERKGYPTTVSTSIKIKSDDLRKDSIPLFSESKTWEMCTSSLNFYLIVLVAVLSVVINVIGIVYLCIRTRRIKRKKHFKYRSDRRTRFTESMTGKVLY